jgi:hypothetical protein
MARPSAAIVHTIIADRLPCTPKLSFIVTRADFEAVLPAIREQR